MRTDHIKQIVSDYLKRRDTEYAILINGAWGSGKTFFWNHELQSVVEDSKIKPMYVSLNGVNNTDRIEQLIFIQLLPKLGDNQNDILKNLTTVSTNLANAASKFFFKSDLTDLAKGTSIKAFNFKKYCICFDDLERCKIPIDELFGFLADFVERKHLKCVILADEPKVKDHQMNSSLVNGYDMIKEKIIGRVLNYEPELDEIVPKFIENYRNQKHLYSFLKEKQDFVISLFKEQNIENLRIINFYFDNVATIYPYFKGIEELYVDECIFFTAVISIEFKLGKLTSKDVGDFKGLEEVDMDWYSRILSSVIARKDKDEPREKSYVELFHDTYLKNRLEQYYFYPNLYNFILSGFFSESDFKIELENRKPKEEPKHIVAFRKLLDYKFRELDDTTFKKLAKEVYENAKNGIFWMYDYKHIASFYFYFSEEGLIETTVEEIKKDLLKGLQESASRMEIHRHAFESLRRFGSEKPEVQEIIDEIARLHKEIQTELDNRGSKKVLFLIKEGDKEEIAQFFTDNKHTKEILPFIKPSVFVEVLKNSPNEIVFLMAEIFRERYDYKNPGEFMAGDLDFLQETQTLIESFLKTEKDYGTIRTHNFYELNNNISEAVLNIKNTINH